MPPAPTSPARLMGALTQAWVLMVTSWEPLRTVLLSIWG